LKIFQELRLFENGTRDGFPAHTKRRQATHSLPNIPLNRMKTVATVGDMRYSEIFAGRKQVFYSLGDQSAEGDLEGQRADVEIVVAA
jgi:hypothetical protein